MTNTIDRMALSAEQVAAGQAQDVTALLLKAQAQARNHITVEITENIDDILNTLTATGPYAYTLSPASLPPVQKVISTREEIRQCYVDLHAGGGLRDFQSTSQVNSPWYSFHVGWSTMELKADGSTRYDHALVIFPTFGEVGITGELFWPRVVAESGVTRVDGERDARLAIGDDHSAYLEAYRRADVEAILGWMQPGVQTAVRDYLADQPRLLTELDGAPALGEYLGSFFERFQVQNVEIVQRHVDDWFVFSETKWTVFSKLDHATLTYSLVEYAVIGPDRKVLARIGHGTDPVPA